MPTDKVYSFKAVCDTIYEHLKPLEWVKVAQVYNYDIKLPEEYNFPCIIVTPNRWHSEVLDSCSWEDYMVITIRLADKTFDGYNAVEQNLREVADIIMNKMREIDTGIGWSFGNGYTVNAFYSYNWSFMESTEPIRLRELNIRFTAVQGLGSYTSTTPTPTPDNNENENENNW